MFFTKPKPAEYTTESLEALHKLILDNRSEIESSTFRITVNRRAVYPCLPADFGYVTLDTASINTGDIIHVAESTGASVVISTSQEPGTLLVNVERLPLSVSFHRLCRTSILPGGRLQHQTEPYAWSDVPAKRISSSHYLFPRQYTPAIGDLILTEDKYLKVTDFTQEGPLVNVTLGPVGG